jgi:hypothetical protein
MKGLAVALKAIIGVIFFLVPGIFLVTFSTGCDITDYDWNTPQLNDFGVGDMPAVMIYRVEPEFPRSAMISGVNAIVWMKALVDNKGNVRNAIAIRTSQYGFEFDQASIVAAYRCKYRPAYSGGVPIEKWVSYKEVFSVNGVEMQDFAG